MNLKYKLLIITSIIFSLIIIEGFILFLELDYKTIVLKSKRFWKVNGIYIDDTDPTKNWFTTSNTYDWCKGSGIINDPYVIENVAVNGEESPYMYCIYIAYSSAFFIIRNCIFFNAPRINDRYFSGMYLRSISNAKILNNNISYNGDNGIFFQGDGTNNLISNNILFNNRRAGIDLEAFYDNCTISSNLISDNGQDGIVLRQDCDNNIIKNNKVYNSGYSGILLQGGSDNNIVKDNLVSQSYRGITIYRYSSYNTIYNNNLSNSYSNGIHIEESQSNIVQNNIISNNNGDGVRFESWIVVDNTNNVIYKNLIEGNKGKGVSIDKYSFNNLICENSFINNTINAEDKGINNQWDNGTIGNYWDDYIGVDANDDGIGDTPYDITGIANSSDHFPIWDDGVGLCKPSRFVLNAYYNWDNQLCILHWWIIYLKRYH
ncbi:MAG: nitrous oxide reductase family maturation protein NosD [Promethearchaeota archaeon]